MINGSVSVSGNAATITLNNNFDGVFQCSLDGGDFKNCMFMYMYCVCFISSLFKGQPGDVFTGLSAGSHTIDVQFTPDGSSQMLSLKFTFTVGNNNCMYFIEIGCKITIIYCSNDGYCCTFTYSYS